MFLLTKEAAVVVTQDTPSEYLLKDEDIYYLCSNSEGRKLFLEALEKESALVESIGKELIPDSLFEKKTLEIHAPDLSFKKEMGYHHRF